MTYQDRIQYSDFVYNQSEIESKWSAAYGDRMNELVFIGHNIDKSALLTNLQNCLITANEKELYQKQITFSDPFSALI